VARVLDDAARRITIRWPYSDPIDASQRIREGMVRTICVTDMCHEALFGPIDASVGIH
jgi:hypothetical protein